MTKRTFLTGSAALMAALAIAGTAIAAPGGHGMGQRDGKRVERMLDAVDATDVQRAEVQTVMDELKPQRKALGQQLREASRTLRQADATAPGFAALADEQAQSIGQLTTERVRLQSEIRSRIAAILTPEQRASLAEKRAAKMEKRKQRAQRFLERHDG
ncbi:periplasmic heavy metal sensor [bacterium]|nr:periplasmic heavy metal sensor [bacterium]